MRHYALALAALLATPGQASPPPPPPEYVGKAGTILTDLADQHPANVAALFADDVAVSENGRSVATGRRDWLQVSAAAGYQRARIIAYSEAWGHDPDSAGELLIVDTYDTVDRATMPRGAFADPRMASRATLYRFGKDHLIHKVQITQADSFWMTPHG